MIALYHICASLLTHHGKRGAVGAESRILHVPQKRGIEEEIKALRTEHHLEKENVLVQYRALLQEVSSTYGAQFTASCWSG